MAGIYIHIPFCRQACHYCNFHFATSLQKKDDMVAALIKEITSSPSLSEQEKGNTLFKTENDSGKVYTLYFGGGTPSLLTEADLKLIFDALRNRFVFADDIEITLEANPDDITDSKLTAWQQMGINRLSVGIQSFIEDELKWMHRAHTATDSLICIDKIKASGFNNFSVDLIYGSPLLTDEGWKKNVMTVIEKNIPHISCYALTVEPKTALDKMIALKKKAPVDPEKQAQQFLLLMEWMQEAGYEHYEISNFAKPGMRSKHNSSYWSGESYYGFGPSAHSYDGKKRKWNVANNNLYIDSLQKNIIPFEEEVLTITQQLNEYIMTALRTIEGLNLEQVEVVFGNDIVQKLQMQSKKWEATNKLKIEKNKMTLTMQGKLFADGIAADLFF
jgi:oxygen-independent coproporphyrinogen-3 oxidase